MTSDVWTTNASFINWKFQILVASCPKQNHDVIIGSGKELVRITRIQEQVHDKIVALMTQFFKNIRVS